MMYDEAGKRYGRLTVVEKVKRDLVSVFKRSSAQWRCRCDCGRETTVFGNKLRKGEVKNCLTCERVWRSIKK